MGKGNKRGKGTKKSQRKRENSTCDDDSGGEDDTGGSCSHARQAVRLNGIQNTFPHWKIGHCKDCGKIPNEESADSQDIQKAAAGICICLRCGHQSCSRQCQHQHAYNHYLKIPSHAINVNLKTWMVWCYVCDKEVNIGGDNTALYKSVKYLKTKLLEACETGNNEAQNTTNFISSINGKEVNKSMTKVKGMKNLGNTCFFNSVMQNIMRTQILKNELDVAIEVNRGQEISFKSSGKLEQLPINISDPPGPLTEALRNLLDEVNLSSQRILSPGRLFGEISKKAPQFRGYRQQDSQELLRYLLDGMRTEELQRINGGLQIAMKDLRSDKRPDKDEIKASLKATKTFVDEIFGGTLVSTVTCQECYTTSQSYEAFLDLSLSVAAARPVVQEMTSKNIAKRKESKHKLDSEDSKEDNEQEDLDKKAGNKEKPLSKHQKKVNQRKERKAKKGKGKSSQPGSSADCQVDEEDKTKTDSSNTNEGDIISNQIETPCSSNNIPSTKDNNEFDVHKIEAEETIKICENSDINHETPLLRNTFNDVHDNNDEQSCCESVAQERQEENETIHQNLKGGDPTRLESDPTRLESDPTRLESNVTTNQESETTTTMKQCSVECCVDLNGLPIVSPYDQSNSNCDNDEKHSHCCNKSYVSDIEYHDQHGSNKVNDQSSQSETITGQSETIAKQLISNDSNVTESTCETITEQLICKNSAESTKICLSFEQLNLEDVSNNKECCSDENRYTNQHDNATNVSDISNCCNQNIKDIDLPEMLSELTIDDNDVKEEKDTTDVEAEEVTSNQVDLPTTDIPLVQIDYTPKAGECSVMTCLQQFCKIENLDGHNKYGCGTCFTRRREGDSNGSPTKEQTSSKKEQTSSKKEQTSCKAKNTIFTKATKQFLIYNPPKILTLHLKRFQQTGNNLRKINKHIEFPLLLDLSPFCYKDTVEKDNNLQYSLYGIVEHSGSLHGGHYVAHVKLKPTAAEMKPKWYYISDTQVSEAQQETVLRKQAYLLFYEKSTN